MIHVSGQGDFEKTRRWLTRIQNGSIFSDLERYAKEGVDALERATPVDTRLTAGSWYYKIKKTKTWPTISWHNDNIVDGVPVVILIQYGHGTRGGTYIQGRDFINPVIQPLFDKIADNVWKKVTAP